MTARKRPRLAVYWAAACGGCDISILAIDTKILDLAAAFDIVFWPCIMDGKLSDVEALPDGSIALTLWSGSVRSDEHEHMAELLRRKSRWIVAFGSCAHEGGIPALANLVEPADLLQTAYRDVPSIDRRDGPLPSPSVHVDGAELRLPVLTETVRTLDQTVEVDWTVPGCPPEAERIAELVDAVLKGTLPPHHTVIGKPTPVCDECARRRDVKKIPRLVRTWQIEPDPERCLLEQGLVCCGVATRGGCGARCPSVGSPCLGCHGPAEGDDMGARMMAALGSVIDSADADEVDGIVAAGIPDPIGTFYRFGLARGFLHRRRPAGNH